MSQVTVLITGATAGIGRATALHLARGGLRVIATGRRADALAELKREAGGLPLDVIDLDVNSAESIAAAVESVAQLTGGEGVDVLVNNAGYGMAAPLLETTDADLRAQYDTNVFGLMAVTRAFAVPMVERGAGRIINVSSVGGRVTLPFFGAYNSTKYAVESLSDALRRELGAFGVHVSLIEPGPIRSDFSQKTMDYVERYSNADSPYASVYERADEIRKMTDRAGGDPLSVARAIEHAAVARWPRPRYVMPKSSAMFLWFATRLPTRWLDALLSRAVGIRKISKAPTPQQLPA